MSILKWFQLVDADGNALSSTTAVQLNVETVLFFREAVKSECPNKLAAVDADDLVVFATRAAFDVKAAPLRSSASLTNLGRDEDHTLVVVVPKPIPVTRRVDQQRRAAKLISHSDLAALVTAAATVEAAPVGTLLAMPETVFNTDVSHGLYIRQEYKDVYKLIADELTTYPDSILRVLVTGSPGIGTSVFSIFMVLVWMSKHRDFAYSSLVSWPKYFTWTPSGYTVSDQPLAGKSYDGFFDGDEKRGALYLEDFKLAFLFASPRTTNHNQFVKVECLKVYMNPWTRAECQGFADAIQVKDEAEWTRRFNLVGGNPRFLFSRMPTYDALVVYVKGAVPQTLKELQDVIWLLRLGLVDSFTQQMIFLFNRSEVSPGIGFLTPASPTIEAMMQANWNQ